jgi:hypothetical protein
LNRELLMMSALDERIADVRFVEERLGLGDARLKWR